MKKVYFAGSIRGGRADAELYGRTSKLGASHMTGGDNEFYFKIGFEKGSTTLYLEKLED